MNYIDECEEILKSHRKLYFALQTLEKRKLKIIEKGIPAELAGIDYSRPAIQKFDYSEDVMKDIYELMDINAQIGETKLDMKLVDDILEDINKENEELCKFLKIKYITDYKKSLSEIAKILGYSQESTKTINNIKKKALKEFAIRYFGARATHFM